MRRRVVISGCGVVTAAGNELAPFWSALMRGECFIKPLRGFAHAEMGQLLGAEVELPDADRLPKEVDTDATRARCLELGLAAAKRAIADAGLSRDDAALERVGVSMGTTMGEERQLGDLRVVKDADVVELLLDRRRHASELLEVVGNAARSGQRLEAESLLVRLSGQRFDDDRLGRSADVNAKLALGA